MFKIGINGADLEGKGTGVKRSLLALLSHLDFKGKEYFIYSRSELDKNEIPNKGRFNFRNTGHSPDYSYTGWEQIHLPGLLKKDRIDIFFSSGYSLPLRAKIPSLVVIHDLSFHVHPQWYGKKERIRRKIISRKSAKKAKTVFTVSQYSKSELIQHYGLPEDKIVILPNAVKYEDFAKTSDDVIKSTMNKYDINSRYILAVGLLLERRYIKEIIKAFAITRSDYRGLQLVLVGKNQLNPPEVLESLRDSEKLDKDLVHINYATEDELVALYKNAAVFIYLSDYEGFGIPPLEAMASGTPVITSDKTALRENYSKTAYLISDHSVEGIAGAFREVFSDEKLRNELIKKGTALAESLNWEKTGEIFNREIDKMIEKYLV